MIKVHALQRPGAAAGVQAGRGTCVGGHLEHGQLALARQPGAVVRSTRAARAPVRHRVHRCAGGSVCTAAVSQSPDQCSWSNVTKNDEDTQHLLHACDAALGEEYYRVSEQAMFEIKGAIYVLAKHRPFVTNVQQTFEPTGIAGFGYNKGGVMFCFSFYESHLAFVNTHLAAHMAKIKERNQDAAKVLNATLTYSFGRPLIDASHQFDAVWFVGDLNYRIEDISFSACCEQVDESIASQDWSVLTGKDQFLGEQAHNRVLHGFSTFEHDFPPTYKYFRSEDVLKHQYTGPLHKQVAGRLTRVYTEEKNRPPAWCDRILWRTLDHSYCSLETNKRRNLVCTGYGPVEEVVSSDHSPVAAAFSLNVMLPYIATKLDPDKQALILPSNLRVSGFGRHTLVLRLSSDCLELDYTSKPLNSEASMGRVSVQDAAEHEWGDRSVDVEGELRALSTAVQHPLVCLYPDKDRLQSQFLFVNVLSVGNLGGLTPVGCCALSLWDFVNEARSGFRSSGLAFHAELSCCGVQQGTVSGCLQFQWRSKHAGVKNTAESAQDTQERTRVLKSLTKGDMGAAGLVLFKRQMDTMRGGAARVHHSVRTWQANALAQEPTASKESQV
eukprot:TRINITY_DN3640_c0_g1_i6.p1 TRINITY_DN3640_c0_g1~~TRINITY_DN3640_c0_g1_i6.p1  ORF type:complete len:611 (-),score=188.68 TRINITY_DN3640_c0_g1_i6:289-2121(-)